MHIGGRTLRRDYDRRRPYAQTNLRPCHAYGPWSLGKVQDSFGEIMQLIMLSFQELTLTVVDSYYGRIVRLLFTCLLFAFCDTVYNVKFVHYRVAQKIGTIFCTP